MSGTIVVSGKLLFKHPTQHALKNLPTDNFRVNKFTMKNLSNQELQFRIICMKLRTVSLKRLVFGIMIPYNYVGSQNNDSKKIKMMYEIQTK